MKFLCLYWILTLCVLKSQAQNSADLLSPDRSIGLTISFANNLSYSVSYKGKPITGACEIDMVLEDNTSISRSRSAKKSRIRSVNAIITSPVPEKRINIPDVFNEMRIDLNDGFYVVFRAYNDGVAYRIGTSRKDSIKVMNEVATFNFLSAHPFLHSKVQAGRTDIFHTSFEENYNVSPLDSISGGHLVFNPAVICPVSGPKIAITESDVLSYPGMFLTGTRGNTLKGQFAPFPKEEKAVMAEFSQVVVSKRDNFLARTAGTRQFPWRILMIAPEDKDLPANDLVYRLATPSRISDLSWITPMQATDEWIITENIFNVDFKSGINTATYKYYIDFAKKFGIESVMMDAGWSDNNDLFKITPGLDIEEIMAYAKSKGVKMNMWTLAMTLDKQLDAALQQFNRWGVGFIMTDFIDRDDQKANDMFNRISEACAKHKIMIMFHGAPKPSGYNRTYPHAITREGVLGSEFNMWSYRVTPEHNVTLPFTRLLAGPMDYEPGLLANGTKKTFRPIEEMVMSYGTRTNQLAMYIVYESPVQFFSGNPSQGLLEPSFMELLGSIPTVWDTTIIVDAKISDYIITARKKGNDWFIGAMTDSVARPFSVKLDFLQEGDFQATICEDGINADRYAADYRLHQKIVGNKDVLTFTMQPGGGFVARLRKN
jgi:alpha-glucosidase